MYQKPYQPYSSVRRVKNFSYSPSEAIGRGYSSTVYRGVNQDTKEPVAIKAIDMKKFADLSSREMLDYEIEALTTLSHPNIMKCYDVVKESSHCYVITELCTGGDMGELIKKRGRFAEQEAAKYLKEIVKGYIEIATKGFMHRDLKLANVLISNGQVKIADFGFAKKCRAESIREKYNVGSPLYMSPEALKHNIYSVKNDIWSIGIMAYEMLHGETPWLCKTETELKQKMTKIPIRFRENLKISNAIKQFIRKCLQVNQANRMSLDGLRQWVCQSSQNIEPVNNENIPLGAPRLIQKTSALEKPQSRPLSELTNRMPNQKSKSVNKIKVNHIGENTKEDLTKSKIDFNNNLIIKEMIVFRLFFKALQKLKNATEMAMPAQLKNILGNQTIRRVTLLKKLVCSEDLTANHHFLLKNVQSYLNPIMNPDIKKYKAVVQQYFNKYTSEIKMQVLDSNKSTPGDIITSFLKGLSTGIIEKQKLAIHWLINLTKVSNRLSKGELESILEPKHEISTNFLRHKIQEMVCA